MQPPLQSPAPSASPRQQPAARASAPRAASPQESAGLERVVRLAVRALGVDAACFVPAGGEPPVWAGPLAEMEFDADGLRGLVMGVVVVAEDTAEAPMLAALAPAARFFASVPVASGRRRLGALCLFCEEPRPFPPEDQQVLGELAALAAGLTAPPEASGRETIYRTMFEQADQFVGLLTPDGTLVEINPRALTAGGLQREEVVGQLLWACPWFARVPDASPAVQSAVERAAAGERVRFEVGALRGDGRCATVALTLTPLLEDGRVRHLMVEGRDVSEQKQMQEEIRARHTELERIFFASPDAIIFTDPDRVIRKVSAAAARLFGAEPEALVGRSVRQLYAHEEDYERQGEVRFSPEAPEQTEPFRAEWRHEDGSTFIGETVGVPIWGEEGEHIGYLGMIRDVTAQEQAAQALRERETLLRTVIENTPVVLYALDANGVFTLHEGQGAEAAGLDARQFVGRPLREVYAEKPDIVERNERVLAGEVGRWVSEVGSRFFETHAAPLFEEDGAIAGMIGVGVDVTERIRAEAGLREATRRAEAARREAEQAAEFKSAFLASMSHEIRTPLTGMLGFAEILAEALPEEYREPARMIEVGGRQLLDTINSVLDFARLEAAEVEVRAVPVNVVELVEEAVGLLRPLARAKDLALECEAIAPPTRVHTDPVLLTRIVNNLVGNALKFTRRGGVSVEVRGEGTDLLVLRVCDTGEGIPPDFLPHLFQAFRQGERPGAEQQGSGLGLAITKRMVELMGGQIEVESTPGAGSTFTVRLPRTVAQPEPALAANSR